MANVFITGGTGLLGTHLIMKLAEEGVRPRALYRSTIPELVRDKADWQKGDLGDIVLLEELLQHTAQVYHCAGHISYHKRDKDLMHQVNVEGTANLVNAALAAGVNRLLHVSSVAALGRIRQDAIINESMNWSPETSNSEYGKTKFLGELEAWRGYAEGLDVVVVNPSIIMGEYGDWSKGSMQIFESIHNGFPYYTLGATGYVDADDAARAMIQLMESDISGERFILNGENKTFRDAFYSIADAFRVKRPRIKVTPFLAGLGWSFEKLKSLFNNKSPLVTRETAKTGLATSNFDNSKILKALPGFEFTSFENSVARITAALKKNYA